MAALTTTTGAQHAAILGVGAYRPLRVVPNSDVVDAIDSSDEWIQQRSGIKTRRWAGPDESVQMMSVEASRIAIDIIWTDSSGPAQRRVLMPERCWIHSSLESIASTTSEFGTTRTGR